MTDERSAEVAHNRALWALMNERVTDAVADDLWRRDAPAWGLFELPERELEVLGDVPGLDVLDLACGTASLSAWLARTGARPVAADLSGEQLSTARRLQATHDLRFPLVQADAERIPFAADCFDLVVSEHGAAAWCDPRRWLGEVARVLRPGGRLVFLTNSLLSALTVPEEEGRAGDQLLRGQREVRWVRWPGGGVEFHPSHGEWIAALGSAGFQVTALHELYAPPGASDPVDYEIVSAEWAQRWPAEELWVATLRA